MKKYVFYLSFTLLSAGCSRYPSDVELALRQAGDNRAELEKVLEHYGKRPEDRLKLQSAYFLIANMPFNFTVRDPQLESFRAYIRDAEIDGKSWAHFRESHPHVAKKTVIEPDIQFMTSAYLIRNIDFSFKVWEEAPWGKDVPFETFCEEILPYRLDHEPLEYWKEAYYATFQPVLDTTVHGNRIEDICKHLLKEINKRGWIWDTEFVAHGFGATALLHAMYGTCKEQAELVAYMLRSVGIPAGIDIVIQIPNNLMRKHYWNYTHTKEGDLFGFDISENYLVNGRWEVRKTGKVYRQCFSLQKESLRVKNKDMFIPEGGLNELLLRDVSHEYFPDTHIAVRPDVPVHFGRKDLAYLCVFNNREWIPVAYGVPYKGNVAFRNVEPDILYQVRLITRIENRAASSPFILLGNGEARFLDADTVNSQSMTLRRKYRTPPVPPFYAKRSVGGKFQGANRSDFSDSVTLHVIQNPADLKWAEVKPGHPGKFKYVRYLSAPFSFNNMAEIRFYSEGMRLSGEVIGTDSSQCSYPQDTRYAVFDGDPLTFFEALYPSIAWAGLKLEKARRIDAILYIFRNDDNSIRQGDTYELLYNRQGEWVSTGQHVADTMLLQYENMPSNTLYWLRNHTRGREERPFIYENGEQIFY